MIGDRIVGATWAFAAAMTRGDITVNGVDPHHLDLVLEKLRMAGAEVEHRSSSTSAWCSTNGRRRSTS